MSIYRIKIGGKDFEVKVGAINGGIAQVEVNGKAYEAAIEPDEEQAAPVSRPAPKAAPAAPAPTAQAAPKQTASASGREVKAPLPGTIINIGVTPGQEVRRGQRIAVLEAMKMENDILSPADGVITSVRVAGGDSVLEGAVIAVIG